jgi:hypothetical protein
MPGGLKVSTQFVRRFNPHALDAQYLAREAILPLTVW